MSRDSVGTAAFFRALDESDLDVYETRFLMRVWRRGTCWEKLQSIAETTGMSLGKASQVRRDLLAKGWLNEVIDAGRVAYQVAIPTTGPAIVEVQDVKSIVVEVQDVKTDVAVFHVVEPEFHVVKPEFHVVSALPFNRQIEDYTIKYSAPADDAPPTDDDRAAKQAAWEATVDLIQYWEHLTKRKRPPDGSSDLREKWIKPFNEIWIACGRNVDAAKVKIQAVRDSILAGGGRIFDPAKLPSHVQALVDTELLPMTTRFNGNGHGKPAPPKSVSTPAPGSQPLTW